MSLDDLPTQDGDSLTSLEAYIEDRRNVDDRASEDPGSPVIYNISSYGADLTAEQHVKRMNNRAYIVPEFQRSYVWTPRKASRFIESLLLGLPTPSIFLDRKENTGESLIIDGQQRLKTLQFFYSGALKDRSFRLTDVHEKWLDKAYDDLDKIDQQNLDDAIIHTIIFKQDQPSDDLSSVHHVFERLNTGGMNLSSQEIRTAVSHGPFAGLLSKLNENDDWRAIYGKVSPRMKDQELILRFLALFFRVDDYERPMVEFLNNFMADHAEGTVVRLEEFRRVFEGTIACARSAFGDRAFRPQNALNAAVFDGVMVGLAHRLQKVGEPRTASLAAEYKGLVEDSDFKALYQKATADKDSVQGRIERATAAFEHA